MADAVIGCWEAKAHYNFWRPQAAIREVGTDAYPATVPDPAWTPLLPTPNHPYYPSGHSCVSGAAGAILADRFGERTRFSIETDNMLGVTLLVPELLGGPGRGQERPHLRRHPLPLRLRRRTDPRTQRGRLRAGQRPSTGRRPLGEKAIVRGNRLGRRHRRRRFPRASPHYSAPTCMARHMSMRWRWPGPRAPEVELFPAPFVGLEEARVRHAASRRA